MAISLERKQLFGFLRYVAAMMHGQSMEYMRKATNALPAIDNRAWVDQFEAKKIPVNFLMSETIAAQLFRAAELFKEEADTFLQLVYQLENGRPMNFPAAENLLLEVARMWIDSFPSKKEEGEA